MQVSKNPDHLAQIDFDMQITKWRKSQEEPLPPWILKIHPPLTVINPQTKGRFLEYTAELLVLDEEGKGSDLLAEFRSILTIERAPIVTAEQ